MGRLRYLNCELYPATIVFVDDEKEYSKLMKKADEGTFREAKHFPPQGQATTIYLSGEDVGVLILVVLGDTTDQSDFETNSILIHEAVHVKQFIMEAIGEEYPGHETEAYAVQYFAEYLISEWNYRQEKRSKQTEKAIAAYDSTKQKQEGA